MSPENLRQIEDAFHTTRDEYANLDTSMNKSASMPPPTIITEDTSSETKTTVFSPEEMAESELFTQTMADSGEKSTSSYQKFLLFPTGVEHEELHKFFWLHFPFSPVACM